MPYIFVIPGSITVETISIKTEPGPREEFGREIPNTEFDVDLMDVKQECLERSDKIIQPAGKTFFYVQICNSCRPYFRAFMN